MNCEICGKSIQGRPLRTKIDGAVLEVCSDCAKLGRIQKQPTSVQQNLIKNKKRVIKKPRNSSQNTSSRVYTRNMDTGEEIVEDYNILIRSAREKKGWTREELGSKMYEKVSVISRIESGKMEPDLKLAKKFEKCLDIKLIEKYDDVDLEAYKSMSSGPNTLGSIVKIKRK